MAKYLQSILLILQYVQYIFVTFILHERSERIQCIEVKGIQKGITISPICLWTGRRVSACVSIQIKKLNNFGRNARILMKFSGSVQLNTNNFWVGGLRAAGN